jgi:hypothetical protein
MDGNYTGVMNAAALLTGKQALATTNRYGERDNRQDVEKTQRNNQRQPGASLAAHMVACWIVRVL